MNKALVVFAILLIAAGIYLAKDVLIGQLGEESSYRSNQVLWTSENTDNSHKRASIEKIEIVSESCDKITFKVSYRNSGKTDGYIRFNTSSKKDLEGSRGDHSITLRQGKDSDVYQEWIIDEAPGGVTDSLWVSLEEIVDGKFHDIVDRIKLPLTKTWDHQCK